MEVKTQDKRQCRFYVAFLNKEFKTSLPYGLAEEPKRCCELINSVLDDEYRSTRSRDEFILDMQTSCADTLIPLERFQWIKSSDRCCYWAWGFLRCASDRKLGYRKDQPDEKLMYEHLGLPTSPIGTELRFDVVTRFFDEWDAKTHHKLDILNEMENTWRVFTDSKKPFKWLDESDLPALEWAWDYLKTRLKDIEEARHICSDLQPLKEAELFQALHAAYYVWDAHTDTKTLFLKNIEKAWGQRKTRAKKKGLYSLSVHLSEDTGRKLNVLKIRYDENLESVLERLINEKYSKS